MKKSLRNLVSGMIIAPVLVFGGMAGAQSLDQKAVAQPTLEEKVKKEEPKWQVTLGGTYALPKLSTANHDIHKVEGQLRTLAPGVKKFEDWSDVPKGTVGVGISRNFNYKGISLWPELFIAYGTGDIKTDQTLKTIYQAPMNYDFKQTYKFWLASAGLFADIYKKGGFSTQFGGYITGGHLAADTKLDSTIKALGAKRRVRGEFSDYALGVAPNLRFLYSPESWKGFGVMAAARYDWIKFSGPTKVKDTQVSPQGSQTLRYDQKTKSDMTGPSFFFGVYKTF